MIIKEEMIQETLEIKEIHLEEMKETQEEGEAVALTIEKETIEEEVAEAHLKVVTVDLNKVIKI